MKKPLVVHPFLLGMFPIFFLFAHNPELVLVSEILLPSAIVLSFTCLSMSLLRRVLGHVRKAGMLVSIFWVLFFSYGHVFDVVQDLVKSHLGNSFEHTYLLLTWAILFALYICLVIRLTDLTNWTRVLNFIAISLVTISLIRVGVYKVRARGINVSASVRSEEYAGASPIGETNGDPLDIYYIILDRYASSIMLQEHFNYDNSEFTDYLTSRGFYIASEARANYPRTFQSLASSLNMRHLTYLTDELGRNTSDQTIIYGMLQNHEVWRFLRSRGYKFIHFGSWWEPTRCNRYADVNFTVHLAEFRMMLYRSTILEPIGVKLGFPAPRQMQQGAVLLKFDKLAEVPSIEGPKFVFVHMLLPHSPYLFGPQGEILTQEQIEARTHTENYLNQLVFTNRKVKRLIDEIQSGSEQPPIILLQADEGPLDSLGQPGEGVTWEQLSPERVKAHMRIFSAYYLPNTDPENVLYPAVTPVNSFRIVFDHYFGTDYGLLEDSSYVFEDLKHPYSFIDVTDVVKYR